VATPPERPKHEITADDVDAARDTLEVTMSAHSQTVLDAARRGEATMLALAKAQALQAAVDANILPITVDRGLLLSAGFQAVPADDERYFGLGKNVGKISENVRSNTLPRICDIDAIAARALQQAEPAAVATFAREQLAEHALAPSNDEIVLLLVAQTGLKFEGAQHMLKRLKPAQPKRPRGRPPKDRGFER